MGAKTGEEFFNQLIEYTQHLLETNLIMIGELLPCKTKIRSLAGQLHRDALEIDVYELAGTPCERVIAGESLIHVEGIQHLYPNDQILTKLALEGYIGVPMENSLGEVIGLITAMSRSPLADSHLSTSILEIVAVRAAAELERLHAERTLQRERAYFHSIIDQVPDPLMVVNTDYEIELLNKAARNNIAPDKAGAPLLHCYEASHHRDTPCSGHEHPCPMQEALNGRPTKVVHTHYNRSGAPRVVEVHATPMMDSNGAITGIIEASRDITEQQRLLEQLKQNERALKHSASHDTLTGLPNRVLFNDRLQHAITKSKRSSTLVAVLFIDLDHFKEVNDTLGHDVGDELLREVAQTLTRCVRSSDTVARLGGDEFTVVLEDLSSSDSIDNIAEKIITQLSSPLEIDNHEVRIGASIGISVYPIDGGDAQTLMKQADIAMYRAKQNGRRNHAYFSDKALSTDK